MTSLYAKRFKQLALGLNTMPADFINAYVLGSVGTTGSVTGACATFAAGRRLGKLAQSVRLDLPGGSLFAERF